MVYLSSALSLFFLLNTLLAILTVFREKRDIAATWAWLLVLILMPGIGFVIYIFLGRKISKEKIFDIQTQENIGMAQLIDAQIQLLEEEVLFDKEDMDKSRLNEMGSMFLQSSNAVLTKGNRVDLIVDGKEKFDRMIADIETAQHHVHVTYYIFKNDEIGRRVLRALEERAALGVEVLVIYDPLGSRGVRHRFFDKLRSLGGEAEPFFGSRRQLINLRINYRNHRKIVIVDGTIGYTGGFNIGDDYLGKYPKMGDWRDTHIRIEGNGVMPLQTRFLKDWNASVKSHILNYTQEYFPVMKSKGEVELQIVSSGPDTETQAIKKGYLKMITSAKKSISIQTPYFVPDESVIESLEIALLSNIQVRIMIPNKPDHPFIYRATLYYVSELVRKGAEVYIYDAGFLHAKTMVIDSAICSIGTANFDIRSFKLNFEINAFMYNKTLSEIHEQQFNKDVAKSYLLTEEIIENFSTWEIFKQKFSRLFSPIL